MSQQSYHFRRKGEEIDLLLDKAGTAIQEVKTINGVSIVGKGNIQVSTHADSELSDTSTNAIQNKVVSQALKRKVEKEDGKGLSTEDFTTQLKSKLNSLENYDDIEIKKQISSKVDKVEGKQLSTEDFTTPFKSKLEGLSNYDDTKIAKRIQEVEADIPTKVSQLENDRGYLTEHQDISNLASKNDLAKKQDVISDLATIRSGAALGSTAIQSVKTINGQSIEGEGNITIEGGGSNITVDSELSDTSENPVQNKVVKSTFDGFAQEVIRLHEEQGAGMQEMSTNLLTALLKKVDKVSGKQLSTEDFTTALKTKLEGLNNYDDTAIQNAVNSLTTQIAGKVDKTYVDNAIANAITTTLNTAV